jgi:hypothetical protein
MVPQGLIVSPRFAFLVIFGAFSWRFSCGGFETFYLGFGGGCMHEPFVVLFILFPLPNP